MTTNAVRGQCECCGYDKVPVTSYPHDATSSPMHGNEKSFRLCALCANTRAGSMYQYHNPELPIFAHVCFVGNCILWGVPK